MLLDDDSGCTLAVGSSPTLEKVVADVAARFVNVDRHHLGDHIVDSLREIAERLDLDRATVWLFDLDGGDGRAAHSWTRQEFRAVETGLSARTHVPWLFAQAYAGQPRAFRSVDEVPDPADRESLRRYGIKSSMVAPFMAGCVRGAVSFTAVRGEREWPTEVVDRLRVVASVFGQALARKDSEDQLQRALEEVQQLRDRLAVENVHLRREVKTLRTAPHAIVAESDAAKRVLEQIDLVAATNATVLMLGETGSGKEVFAQAIHCASPRRHRPTVVVNCGAIPSTLIESELFGRERGAYTGSVARQIGRFELANGSTIFLDEIGELPLEAQVKILRVLQDKSIERLGSGQSIKVDVRIIAATNRDLEKAVADRTFREDLYYRLNVFPITVPPLRERVDDIPGLVWTFVEELTQTMGKTIDAVSKDSLVALQRYDWPGNVRELRNVVERAVISAKTTRLSIDPPKNGSIARPKSMRLVELEATHIQSVLERVNWRVRGAGGAAELLGMNPTTLDSRMAKLGIRRPAR